MTARKDPPAVLVCPGCGTYGSIECFASAEDASEVQKMLAKLPADVGPMALAYMRLFAPHKRALTWRRKRKLLSELLPMIEAQQVRYNGRDWAAPHPAWISAIQTMLDSRSIDPPLPNHNYLLKILAGDANKIEAAAESQVEAARKSGKPAATLDEQLDQSQQFQVNVRNAKAFVAHERAVAKMRFREEYSAQSAAEFLKGRNYDQGVIDAVIADLYGATS